MAGHRFGTTEHRRVDDPMQAFSTALGCPHPQVEVSFAFAHAPQLCSSDLARRTSLSGQAPIGADAALMRELHRGRARPPAFGTGRRPQPLGERAAFSDPTQPPRKRNGRRAVSVRVATAAR